MHNKIVKRSYPQNCYKFYTMFCKNMLASMIFLFYKLCVSLGYGFFVCLVENNEQKNVAVTCNSKTIISVRLKAVIFIA